MADPFSGGIMPQIIQNRQGMQQLEAQRMEMDAMQRQQQMQDEGTSLLERYQASVQSGKPDNNLLYSAVLKSPTAAQNVLNAVGIVDKQQKQQAAGDVVTLMSAIGNPQAFYKATAQRIAAIKARGGDPTDTIEMAKRYQSGDVEGVKNDLMIAGAALANEGLIKPESIGLGQKEQTITPYQQAQLDLRKREVAAAEKRADRPDTQVSVNMPQDKKIAELDAKAFTQYSENAKSARKELNSIAALKPLSERAVSGTGASFLLAGGKILNQLGFQIEGLTESEVFKQLANTLVLDKSQQMSGALSNADMTFLTDTVPTLENTKEGRRLSLDMAERLAKRQLEIQKLAAQYRREAKQNGDEFDDAEFQQYLNQWAEENPLFKDLEIAKPKAPQAAVDYLMQNPQFKQQFMEKYGYLPEGVN